MFLPSGRRVSVGSVCGWAASSRGCRRQSPERGQAPRLSYRPPRSGRRSAPEHCSAIGVYAAENVLEGGRHASSTAAPYPWPSSRCLSQPRGPCNVFLLTVSSAALRPAENKANWGQFPFRGWMLHRPDHSAGNAQTCVKAARKQRVSPVRPAGLRVTSANPRLCDAGPVTPPL